MKSMHKYLVFFISIILFVLPFTWYPQGELDMGGDSARLWLYSPMEYLRSTSLYTVDPIGTARVSANQYFIPHLLFLEGVSRIFGSTSVLVGMEKGLKLSLSFLFVYLLVRDVLVELSKKRKTDVAIESSAFVSGVWYALSGSVTVNMPAALLTHNQVFLNPMMAYLLFRFFLSQNPIYTWIALFVSVLYAPNFSLSAPPQLFAFYPLSVLYIIVVISVILKRSISGRRMIVPLLLFVSLHAFHLIPEVANVTNPGSELYGRAFNAGSDAMGYFNAILGLGKVSLYLLLPPVSASYAWTSVIPVFIMIIGFITTERKRLLQVTGVFFLLTLFLVSANITGLGVAIYRKLFLIPGFGMFRNFIGQWQFVYAFFYAVLFGFGLHGIFGRLKPRTTISITVICFALIIVQNWQFLNGSIANIRHQGADVRISVIMDPQYERMLGLIRRLPEDGKILNLPFTDFYFQLLGGVNKGAYIGPSTIAYLTGRNDFVGYQNMNPFPELFMEFSKKKDYISILRLLGLLNIRYIFHNSDPNIYDARFSGFPYGYMRTALPATQTEYSDFISALNAKMIHEIGPYRLYELPTYTPLFSVSDSIFIYRSPKADWHGLDSSILTDPGRSIHTTYLEKSVCINAGLPFLSCDENTSHVVSSATVAYTKISPVRYRVSVNMKDKRVILTFANQYNAVWELRDVSNHTINSSHFPVNGYANAWAVAPGEYEVEMVTQRYVTLGFWISLIGGVGFGIQGMYLMFRAWYNKRYEK